jgi:hypothetical protein
MYLITYRARIKLNTKADKGFPDVGGAYIGCYIQFKDFRVAEKLARLLIRERGWIPEEQADAVELQKNKLKTKREKELYAEALKYGYTLAFYMWPKDAEGVEVDDFEWKERKTGCQPRRRSHNGMQRTRQSA